VYYLVFRARQKVEGSSDLCLEATMKEVQTDAARCPLRGARGVARRRSHDS